MNYWFTVISHMYHRFQEDEVTSLGAQLTFYLLLAFFPFIIFLITLASYAPVASDLPLDQLAALLPYEAYVQVRDIIEETIQARSHTLLSVGMIAALWASSSGVNAIIRGINKAYFEKETRPFWKVRGLSILFTLALALVIVSAFLMLVLGRIIGQALFTELGAYYLFADVWRWVRYLLPLATMLLVFVLLYRFSPNRNLTLKEVVPGAVLASLGWVITSLAFAWYVEHFTDYARIYGSLGGIVILLLWLYLSSIIILLGGELNAVLSRHGSPGRNQSS